MIKPLINQLSYLGGPILYKYIPILSYEIHPNQHFSEASWDSAQCHQVQRSCVIRRPVQGCFAESWFRNMLYMVINGEFIVINGEFMGFHGISIVILM
jgi:hypothetical protein